MTPENLSGTPQITPMFKEAEGGLRAVLEAMRFYPDEVIKPFLAKYDSIPEGDRPRLPWEAIAIAAGVVPKYLVGSIHVALQAHSVSVSKVIALTGQPKVMKKMVEYAQLPSGEKDRSMFLQGIGFLPSVKGPTFINKAVFGPERDAEDDKDNTVEAVPVFGKDDDLEELFPSSEKIQQRLIPLRQKQLSGGK